MHYIETSITHSIFDKCISFTAQKKGNLMIFAMMQIFKWTEYDNDVIKTKVNVLVNISSLFMYYIKIVITHSILNEFIVLAAQMKVNSMFFLLMVLLVLFGGVECL